MANSNSVKFVDNSEPAKNGLMEQQKLALRAVAKMLRKRVKDAAPKTNTALRLNGTPAKGAKHDGALKKNIGTWVKTDRKTGESKLIIGTYTRKVAEKKGLYHAFYAKYVELGVPSRRGHNVPAHSFLKKTVMASIADIRAEEAKFLPDIKPVYDPKDEDEEVE